MRSFRLSTAMALAALIPLSLFAAGPSQASGKFKGSKVSFDAAGAYAFWSRAADEEPVIQVAVSNSGFQTKAFDAFYDPKPVIDNLFADEETAVVYFQFEPSGKYHGLSYYFGSGDGCGFCFDPAVKSTVKVVGQRIAGTLSFSEKNRSFDVQFDVPVAPKEWGKPLAGDGGEVGTAFRTYNSAMDAENRKAMFAALDSSNQETWTKREKDGKLDDYLAYRAEKVHMGLKDAHIVKGWVRENQAVLLVKGKSPLIDSVHGQVTLTREGGKWKISDELYEPGE